MFSKPLCKNKELHMLCVPLQDCHFWECPGAFSLVAQNSAHLPGQATS